MKKGQRYEYKARDQLRAEGYHVIRSSDSAFPDLVAWNDKEVKYIEVKYAGHAESLSSQKWRFRDALKGVTFPANAIVELWLYSPLGLTISRGNVNGTKDADQRNT